MQLQLPTSTVTAFPKIRRWAKRLFITCVAPVLWLPTSVLSLQSPACPGYTDATYPPFADVGAPPNVATWKKLSELAPTCHIGIENPAKLTMAFASLFKHAGTIEDLAQRLGAISTTQKLRYWSVTGNEWRKLISDAYALESVDSKTARTDFTAMEILSGQTQFFAQNDTSTWGLNLYSLKVINASPDHLILESRNRSRLRLGPITIFKPGDALTVLFIQRLEGATWQYFSLSVIKDSGLPVREKSAINRQAAFYRLLIGQASDSGLPLAP